MSSDQSAWPLPEESVTGNQVGQTAKEPHGSTLGAWLKSGRERAGYSLPALAEALRIREDYLAELERDKLRSLPALPYVSGYVRSYALRVGIDPREANRRLHAAWGADNPALPAKAFLRFADQPRDRRGMAGRFAAIGILASVAAYTAWYFGEVRERAPGTLSPVAELEEGGPTGETIRPAAEGAARSEPQFTLGPLTPVGLQRLPDDLMQDFAPGSSSGRRAASSAETPLPAGPFPRPRPGTPQAAAWAAIYGAPVPVDPAAAPPATRERLADAGEGGLPSAARLSTYLPKLHLRADIGPLNSDIQAVVAALPPDQFAPPTAPAEPLPYRRTQAFAAVPPGSELKDGASEPGQIAAAPRPALPNQVTLRAVGAASWIEVRDAGQRVMLSKLLQAGEETAVPPGDGLTLTTGNATALRIVVDGVQLPAPGGGRSVVRGILLDPATLKAAAGG